MARKIFRLSGSYCLNTPRLAVDEPPAQVDRYACGYRMMSPIARDGVRDLKQRNQFLLEQNMAETL